MSILHPMLTMIAFPLLFLPYMFKTRIGSIRRKEMPLKAFQFMNFDDAPESIKKTTRHWINLFEMPLLFLVLGLIILIIGADTKTAATLGWAFVFCRLAHTYIHVRSNHLRQRMVSFALSYVSLIGLFIYVIVFVASH